MISQANSGNIRNAYTNNSSENKELSKKAGPTVSSQGDMSKVQQMKEALESGEYKVNLQALSEKIADELL
ncbi:MAG: anti-sigma28 factor (negative regulator of flagellin synthesis) [Sulfurimonas sp.]|jgi:anti-sigma28 factor (negative regulator of flagellin synthesis)|uniref:flagellar biosynthesis anti-sigma factor FlgM n=1 Tax=Sulfurimonas sp. TaxID=2022749 RepID=UPI0039E54E60